MGQSGRKIVEAKFNAARLLPDLVKLYEATVAKFRTVQQQQTLSTL
jgi:hypothetical protein